MPSSGGCKPLISGFLCPLPGGHRCWNVALHRCWMNAFLVSVCRMFVFMLAEPRGLLLISSMIALQKKMKIWHVTQTAPVVPLLLYELFWLWCFIKQITTHISLWLIFRIHVLAISDKQGTRFLHDALGGTCTFFLDSPTNPFSGVHSLSTGTSRGCLTARGSCFSRWWDPMAPSASPTMARPAFSSRQSAWQSATGTTPSSTWPRGSSTPARPSTQRAPSAPRRKPRKSRNHHTPKTGGSECSLLTYCV